MLCCKCKTDCASSSCGCRKLGLKYTDIYQCSEDCVNHNEESYADNDESIVEDDVYYNELELE